MGIDMRSILPPPQLLLACRDLDGALELTEVLKGLDSYSTGVIIRE
jgi:hypothetical protein